MASKLRVHKVLADSIQPKLRVFKATADGSVSSDPKLRVHRVTATGAPTGVLRVQRVSLDGTVAITLQPVGDRSFEPFTVCSTTVVPVAGTPTPDTYTWRQISGVVVTLTGTGATRSFVTPSFSPPTTGTVVLGVTGTASGIPGVERTFRVFVTPQTVWTWDGTTWRGGGLQEV